MEERPGESQAWPQNFPGGPGNCDVKKPVSQQVIPILVERTIVSEPLSQSTKPDPHYVPQI